MPDRIELQIPCNHYLKMATVYPSAVPAKGCLLYLHGGGLIYGSRNDLPADHTQAFMQAGYTIIAFDYPLAPAAKLPEITQDVFASVNHFLTQPEYYGCSDLPWFLWGRSAGAYLSLLAAAKGSFPRNPAGILSWYGYGFLCDHWFRTPNRYYASLPKVPASCLLHLPEEVHAVGDLNTHYSAYVYARQTGAFQSLLYEGREKYFFTDYTLRLTDRLPCPLFAAHSTDDPDVPFEEFTELKNRYNPKTLIATGTVHDFDRNPDNPFTSQLLSESIRFLRSC